MTTAPRLTIDLAALAGNWQYLSDRSLNSETAAVVKANAYGLGIEHAVPVLSEAGCRTFFVAMVEEGVRLRKCLPKANVFVLNGIFADTVESVIESKLAPVLSTPEQIAMWTAAAGGKPCAIHVDTGMNRLGLDLGYAEKFASNTNAVQKSGAQIVMSHMACIDDPSHPMNATQIDRFREIASQFSDLRQSLANSAAVLSTPATHLDLTRPGIAMYGGEAVNDIPNPMKPVVRAEARILQIRDTQKGDGVGYGIAHTLTRDSKIAICSVGYADGYLRSSSGSGVPLRTTQSSGSYGYVASRKVPVIGRVSMDLTAFDLTDLPEEDIKGAKWIELFGPNIQIDDVARAAGTIGYEFLTGLGNRYIREYSGW